MRHSFYVSNKHTVHINDRLLLVFLFIAILLQRMSEVPLSVTRDFAIAGIRWPHDIWQWMCRLLCGEELQPFVPQRTHLSIITTGDQYAVATKGWLCLEVCLPAVLPIIAISVLHNLYQMFSNVYRCK